MREIKLPTSTKSFDKMSIKEVELWTILRNIKEDGGTPDDKPEGDSTGDKFCASVEEYLALSLEISKLEKAKKALADFLYGRLVARGLGIITCDSGTAALAAYTKEVQDTEYLKEIAPKAFAVVPDRLQLRVTKS